MKKKELLDVEIIKLKDYIQKYDDFFAVEHFIEEEEANEFLNTNVFPKKKLISFSFHPIYYFNYFNSYEKLYENLVIKYNDFSNNLEKQNKKYITEKIKDFRECCSLVENRFLDNQQVESIIRNNRNVLVVSGAGSGKTTTIIGKIKYLIKKNEVQAKDILLLSYTHISAEELKTRVEKEINQSIETYTFHKLGLNIIKESSNDSIMIYNQNLQSFILERLNYYLNDIKYLSKMIFFFKQGRIEYKDEFLFENEEEYKEYLKSNPPTTLKGEVVKSYGEMIIANFLFENGVDYIYEDSYVFQNEEDRFSYHPDFHIKNSNVYIEYYGIDDDGHVAPYLKGENAEEDYNQNIVKKRKIHKDNGTRLIECYYYEYHYNTLLFNLQECLKKDDIELNLKSSEEMWNEIRNQNNNVLNVVAALFETIINLMKSNNYNIGSLKYMCYSQKENVKNNLLILDLIEPIFNDYNNFLRDTNQIDFNDMINLATHYVTTGQYVPHFKYVIVDEYQDISKCRYQLLASLRKAYDFKLFCVGDDWQSIYRFSGSELDLMLHFEEYWGKTFLSKIEKTYRFSDTLAKISGDFIMKNPNQIQKTVVGYPTSKFPIGIIRGYTEDFSVEFLMRKLDLLQQNSSVFFIGRYNFDIDVLKSSKYFTFKHDIEDKTVKIRYIPRKDLKIKFLTAHKSKGLQADYVFILNNKYKGPGFPSQINDISLIRLILSNKEIYPFSEERRLFYVAMTRSKKKTYFVTIKNNESLFIKEIENNYQNEIKKEFFECPYCDGHIFLLNNQYGKFYKCNNCNYTRNK